MGIDMFNGLHYIHSHKPSIIHRDVKVNTGNQSTCMRYTCVLLSSTFIHSELSFDSTTRLRLQPSNIFLEVGGNARLGDFGFSKRLGRNVCKSFGYTK